MNKATIKHYLYLFGKLLGAAGMLFVFYKLSKEYNLQELLTKFSQIKTILLPLIVLNLLSLLMGIYAWWLMLLNYAQKNFPYIMAYFYFSKTEIAKYLPGNIFHFVGRQAIASKLGISQKTMGKVSLLFMSLLVLSTLVAATFFALFATYIPFYLKALLFVGSVIALVSLKFVYPTFEFVKKLYLSLILTISIAWQGVILAWIVLYQIDEPSWSLFSLVAGVYIISWLIGFVTPGASGGLGVREGAFVAIVHFLHLPVSLDITLFSIILVRVLNIFVDILMYFSTFLLTKRVQHFN